MSYAAVLQERVAQTQTQHRCRSCEDTECDVAQIPPAYRSDILVTIEGADASDAVIEHLTKVDHREGARSAGPPGGLLDRLAGR